MGLLHGVFFCSGFAAILYQIVWQRALFTIFGTATESVAMVVTAFMLGLGVGGLAGGALSARPRMPHVLAFGMIELAIGAFGFVSLSVFHTAGAWTTTASGWVVGLVCLAVLLPPTLLMGATLPLLATHAVGRWGGVGRSLGDLYSVNTLGSAVGALVAARFVLAHLGERAVVQLAAGLNLLVALVVLGQARRRGR